MSNRPTAEAVVAALQERFRAQRERWHWFRASRLEVRRAIGDGEIVALYRTGEAKQRAAARLAAEQAEPLASATVKERRRLRLQRRRAPAEVLTAGMTQAASAEALGICDRTIRNWAKGKPFQGTLARAVSTPRARWSLPEQALKESRAWLSRKASAFAAFELSLGDRLRVIRHTGYAGRGGAASRTSNKGRRQGLKSREATGFNRRTSACMSKLGCLCG